eukprot:CAMPEP_0116828396 /NCGR_PEP_ID=MMETSP0418-20121206/3634_1 /TAXON_ID=1158023 /ORGANISM="Astrosyne radiata, Strain 13vi08-1A" /LENGTH=319 /DNA_ID=CAMNT_0004457283 /DNA_START=113 /DNA_END=1072 /DNA_ORIENTATION=-
MPEETTSDLYPRGSSPEPNSVRAGKFLHSVVDRRHDHRSHDTHHNHRSRTEDPVGPEAHREHAPTPRRKHRNLQSRETSSHDGRYGHSRRLPGRQYESHHHQPGHRRNSIGGAVVTVDNRTGHGGQLHALMTSTASEHHSDTKRNGIQNKHQDDDNGPAMTVDEADRLIDSMFGEDQGKEARVRHRSRYGGRNDPRPHVPTILNDKYHNTRPHEGLASDRDAHVLENRMYADVRPRRGSGYKAAQTIETRGRYLVPAPEEETYLCSLFAAKGNGQTERRPSTRKTRVSPSPFGRITTGNDESSNHVNFARHRLTINGHY